MKALFTSKNGVSLCLLLMAGLPWSCVDHINPNEPVLVTCKCQLMGNVGPMPMYDTETMECPGGKFTCECGGLEWRGQIVNFQCKN